jgi:hypothetical protein
MRRGTAFVLLALAFSPFLAAEPLLTLRAEFVRTTKSSSSQETVRGTLFFQAPARVILNVKEPVVQWVVFEADGMLLWYPADGRAWRFAEKQPSVIGFSSTFVGVPRDDFGLADAGFALERSEDREEALFTYWKPPAALSRSIGGATIGSRARSPYLLEVKDPKGEFLARVTYLTFVNFGSLAIPSRVELVQKDRGDIITEEVLYSGHQFNTELPEEVSHFHLPPGVVVQDVQW